nr:MAG TPA: hypothetical protein [Caudoviricetes sp.]DAX39198.1 MAG TPA: hypothetical protein [Caudoviricetes sp.]
MHYGVSRSYQVSRYSPYLPPYIGYIQHTGYIF